MFEDLSRMTDFLSMAPYFISIAFAGSFLLTLAAVKLAQSETIYQWFLGRREIMTARHARRIRMEMAADAKEFLGGRKLENISQIEQRAYTRMMESYYRRIDSLYPIRRKK